MWTTLVQPHLDYCSQLWAPTGGANLENLEGLPRSFTSKIPSVKHMNYWERLSHLKMNSLQRRNERYRIIYTWKILEGLVPKCGVEEISESENKRLGRLCKIPKLVGSTHTKKLRSQSLQLIGPTLFNPLPKKLRNMKQVGVDKFKEHLDAYLSEVPD